MKMPDVNVLLNAVNPSGVDYGPSARWLTAALSGAQPVGFTWNILLGFIRISTHARIFPKPMTTSEAVAVVDAWLASRSAHVLQPGPRHLDLLASCLSATGSSGNLTSDAHIAALALEHRATVVTFDSDFGRFPGVRWERPV